MSALRYAQLGWAVIPLHNVRPDGLCTCGHNEWPDKSCECGDPKCKSKHGAGSIGKHPLHRDWPSRATTDPDIIASWRPGNIGVATGAASRIFVVDVDPRNGGSESFAQLIAQHGPLPETTQQQTGSGGWHYVFRLPEGIQVGNGKLGPGLDIKGNGGQIVVWPSVSGSGPYRWVHAPWDVSPAEPPAWLVAMLGRVPAPRQELSERGYFPPASPAVLDEAREALVRLGPAVDGDAGGLHTVKAGMLLTHDFALSDEEAWPLLLEWNATCVPPWEPDELRERLRRGRLYGKHDYGARRTLDAVAQARRRIAAFQEREPRLIAEEEREAAVDDLVRDVREIVARCTDPLHAERIRNELQAATGLRPTALALPKVRARAEVGEPSTDQSTWSKYGLELGSNGTPLANLDNAVRVLEHEKRPIYFEEFAQRIRSPEGEWTDADDLRLTLDMQRRLGLQKMIPQVVSQAVNTYARAHAVDALTSWLEGLTWDGAPRLDLFLVRAHGVEDSEYARAVSSNLWKSLVARALMPGCKCDYMVILEGPQGLRKSTSLQVIAGDAWFAEVRGDPMSKDFALNLRGKLILEVGEMDSFSRAEETAVKQTLSCRIDTLRDPYERRSKDVPRRSVFVGTTNKDQYLRDPTGARRFWPVFCTRIDLDYIHENRDQLFAEAVHRVKLGEPWHEIPGAATLAQQEQRYQEDPWETVLGLHLESVPQDGTVIAVDLLRLQLGIPVERMTKADQARVASILRRLGWERSTGRLDGRLRRLWRRKAAA